MLLNYRDFDGFYRSVENTILAVKEAALAGEIDEDANRDLPAPELWRVIEKLIWQDDFQGASRTRNGCARCTRSASRRSRPRSRRIA